MFSRRFWFRRFFPVAFFLTLIAAVGGLAQFGLRQLTLPHRAPMEAWMAEILASPQRFGFSLQPFTVTTDDGLNLKALMAEPGPAAGETKRGQPVAQAIRAAGLNWSFPSRPRGTLILLHGFNGRKDHMLPFAERFTAAGFRCVLFDSRGHGESGGDYVTFGGHEIKDLQQVITAAAKLAGAQGLGPIGLLGYSMGGAISLQAQPVLPEVRALCSVSSFAALSPILTEQAATRWHGFGLPILPVLRLEARLQAGFDPWAIRPVDAATRVTCPVLLVHGEKDSLVSVRQAQLLAKALGSHCAGTILVPNGTHGSVFSEGGDALWQRMAVFFAREMRPES